MQRSSVTSQRSSELLAAYFPASAAEASTSPPRFTDTDIETIASLLEDHEKSWSRVPRAYIVLRTIGHLDLLNDLLQLGFTDHWFPVEASALPPRLQPSVRNAIVKAQALILTKSVDLEKGESGRHWHFAKGEPQPFKVVGVLGSGGYSQVHRIRSTISFKEYALKRIRRRRAFGNASKEAVRQFTSELKLLKCLKHKHTAEYVGSFTDPSYLGLIMAPVADMNLAEYLETISAHPKHLRRGDLITLRSFFGCLASALQYLHNASIRHRDIKPQNVLVDGSNVLFTDFGLSKEYSGDVGSTTSGATSMTPRYAAPEVLVGDPRNTSSDIWSLGCVFLEMIVVIKGKKASFLRDYFLETGSKEANICKNVEAAENLLKDLKGPGKSVDDTLLDLTRNMLKEDRFARPTAAEAFMTLSTPFENDSAVHFCGICCLEDEVSDSHDSLCEDQDTSVTIPSILEPPWKPSVLVPRKAIPATAELSSTAPDVKSQSPVSDSHESPCKDLDTPVTVSATLEPPERSAVQNPMLARSAAVQPPALATLNFQNESLSNMLNWKPSTESKRMQQKESKNFVTGSPGSVQPDQVLADGIDVVFDSRNASQTFCLSEDHSSSSINRTGTLDVNSKAPTEGPTEADKVYQPSFSISGIFRSKHSESSTPTPKLSRRFAKLLRRPKQLIEKLDSSHMETFSSQVETTDHQVVFGVPLQESIKYANVAISLSNEKGESYIFGYVPIIVANCGVFLKEKGIEAEDIFASGGDEARVSELCTAFNSPARFGRGLGWTGYTVYDAGTTMIRYLESLPEPIVPTVLYNEFMQPLEKVSFDSSLEVGEVIQNNLDSWIHYYRKFIWDMPPLVRQLLLYLLDLLAVFESKSTLNKMTTRRLAKLFSGLIIGPKNSDNLSSNIVLEFFIENQDSFLITDFTESTADTVTA